MSGAWPPPGWSEYAGVTDAPIVWIGPKRVAATLDYTIDITDTIDTDDLIVGATACVAPSGTGEMTISEITVVGNLVTVYLNGGQPARTYTIQVNVSMANSRVFEFLARCRVTPDFVTDQPQVAPSNGYGSLVNAILSPTPAIGSSVGIGTVSAAGRATSIATGHSTGVGATQ